MWVGSGVQRKAPDIHGFSHGPFHLKLPTINPEICWYRWNRLGPLCKVRSKNLRVKSFPSGPSVSPPLAYVRLHRFQTPPNVSRNSNDWTDYILRFWWVGPGGGRAVRVYHPRKPPNSRFCGDEFRDHVGFLVVMVMVMVLQHRGQGHIQP